MFEGHRQIFKKKGQKVGSPHIGSVIKFSLIKVNGLSVELDLEFLSFKI